MISRFNTYKQSKPASTVWMISFADLLSLILSFFVMSYSMSSLNNENWKKYSKEIAEFLKTDSVSATDLSKPYKYKPSKKKSKSLQSNLGYVSRLLDALVSDNKIDQSDFIITPSLNKIEVQINPKILITKDANNNIEFNLSESGKDLIFDFSKIIGGLQNQIELGFLNKDKKISLEFSNYISGKLEESGYEYNILRSVPVNFSTEEHIENYILLTIRSYEAGV